MLTRDRGGQQAAVATRPRSGGLDAAGPDGQHSYLIGDVAALTGLTPHTLRAWERLDLLAPRRSPGGVRQYGEDDIALARLIARTLDVQRLPRRAVATLIRSGELRPSAEDYAPQPVRATPSRTRARGRPAAPDVPPSAPARASASRLLLGAFTRLGDAVARGRERAEIGETVCREAHAVFGVADVVLWLVEPPDFAALPATVPAEHPSSAHPSSARPSGTTPPDSPDARLAVLSPAAAAGARGLGVARAALRLPLVNAQLGVVQAIRARREVVLDARAASTRTHPELALLLPAATLLILPLLTPAGQTVGALVLREALDPERFGPETVDNARLFAAQATHAIELTRRHEELERAHVGAEADQARWLATVEHAPEVFIACDANLRITYCSPVYERTFGQPAHLVAQADTWPTPPTLLLPTEASPFPVEALPVVRALRENRPVHDIEIAHRALDGTRHLLVWSAAPTRGPHGEVLGAVSIGRDVSADRRRAAHEACLSALARAAAGSPDHTGVEGRAARLLDALARHAGLPVITASLHLLDTQAGTVTRIGEYRADSAAGAPPSGLLADGAHAIWRVLTSSAQYSDVGGSIPTSVDQHAPTWRANAGIHAWAIVPLRAGALLLGALAVGLARPHAWDSDERTWLGTCADTMCLALENDRLVAAARRRADELEAVVEGADAGITLYAADGGILMRNAVATALTGCEDDPDSTLAADGGAIARDPVTGAPVSAEANPVARALHGEVVRDALLLMRDTRGRDRLMQTSSTPVHDATGAVVAAVSFVRDATDQMRRTRLYAHLGQALGAILEPSETMRALADALVSIAGIDTVAIYLAAPDGDGLDLLWARNYPLDVLESVRHIASNAPTITAKALRTGQPQVLQNWLQAGAEEHSLTRYLAQRLDLGSGAAIPMLARGRVMGVLMAGAAQGEGFPPAEVGLLLDLAAHAGLAMDNARLYQAAHRSADEQEAIVAAMADPVWVCDVDGRLTSVNHAAAALMGTTPADALGEHTGTIIAPRLIWPDGKPVPPSEAPLERARRGEAITGFEAIIQRVEGDAVRLMLSAAPIRDETSGHITGAVSVGHDITILRQLEHAREEFLAIASHELKTPLTSLLGFVQAARRKESRRLQDLLARGASPRDSKAIAAPGSTSGSTIGPTLDLELLGRIERQALRLDRLVGDLLDVARIQQGRMQYRWAEGDVAGAVAEAVDEQRAASPDRRITLSVPEEPLMARLDADRLRQVVTNLLTNALKYSRAEQPVTVEVVRAVDTRGPAGDGAYGGQAAAVRVRDTGPGIPPEHAERIFERFYRVPGLQVQSGSGIGLGVGLFVAREIVERHGGHIWVESDQPEETTFAFTVPLVAADTQP